MKCVIIAHGTLEDYKVIKYECRDADFIICADGGAEYCFKNNIIPNLLIGDFDSIDMDILNHYRAIGVKVESFPVEKDYTDTEICIEKAIELKADEICIAAGVGGRMDHSLGNIFLLSYIMEKGKKGYIASTHEYVYICRDSITISGKPGDLISIIPIKGNATGLYTEELKYPLKDGEIEFGRALGISNEMLNYSCSIKVGKGTILVIKTENK